MTVERQFYYQRDASIASNSSEASPSTSDKPKLPDWEFVLNQLAEGISHKDAKAMKLYYQSQVAQSEGDIDRADKLFFSIDADVFSSLEEMHSDTLRAIDLFTIQRTNRDYLGGDSYLQVEKFTSPTPSVSQESLEQQPVSDVLQSQSASSEDADR